jgi:hypothetical protein
VTQKNSFGYLTAEYYPLLRYYLGVTLAYLLVDLIWLALCMKHRSQLIHFHHFLSVVLVSQTVQSIFLLIEYEIQNSYGTLLFSFIFFNTLFSVARNTMARVLCLLVAMGIGLMPTPGIRKSRPKIITLTVLYVVTQAAYEVAVYLNKITPVSSSVQLGVSVPLTFTNAVYFFWIVRSLETTEKTLKQRGQTVKGKMIKRFYYLLVVCYMISVAAVCLEIYARTTLDLLNQWQYNWIIEASWFSIFSFFQLCICVLMRPTATSRLLAYVEELNDTER